MIRFPRVSRKFIILLGLFHFPLLILSGCDFDVSLPWQGEEDAQTEYVKGLRDIPVYSGADFLFEGYEETEEVKRMLARGQSAYRLPEDSEFTDVVEFYEGTLAGLGWEHILSVEEDDEDQKPGEYWVSEVSGLRIYTWLNDIWYETITAEQAQGGLDDRVAYEKQIEWREENLLVDLEIPYPFKLKYPKSWEAIREESIYSNGYDLVFESPEQGYVNKIQDLGGVYEQSLEGVAYEYLDRINEKRSKSSRLNTTREEDVFVAGTSGLELVLSVEGEEGRAAAMCFLINPDDQRVYVVVNLRGDENFYNTLKSTLEVNHEYETGEVDDE